MPPEARIRARLLATLGQRWEANPETLIVQEFGTHFGAARIDVAVVNGRLHGHEIKSATDTLVRLPGQIASFNEVFDHLTLVAASKHIQRSYEVLPPWWGIVEATDAEGDVLFRTIRDAQLNRNVKPAAVAALLWRDELFKILSDHDLAAGMSSATRASLVARIASTLPPSSLGLAVRTTIRERQSWRVDRAHNQCDETSRPSRTSSRFLDRRLRSRRPRGTDPPR